MTHAFMCNVASNNSLMQLLWQRIEHSKATVNTYQLLWILADDKQPWPLGNSSSLCYKLYPIVHCCILPHAPHRVTTHPLVAHSPLEHQCMMGFELHSCNKENFMQYPCDNILKNDIQRSKGLILSFRVWLTHFHLDIFYLYTERRVLRNMLSKHLVYVRPQSIGCHNMFTFCLASWTHSPSHINFAEICMWQGRPQNFVNR